MGDTRFGPSVLAIDAPAEACRIARAVESQVLARLHRRGVVVGVSGGVDSAVVVALAALAVGGARVLALLMPERDSSPESLALGKLMAARLGLATEIVDLGPVLEASGCYAEQTAAIRTVFPEYGDGWKSKVVLPPLADGDRLNVFSLVVESPTGETRRSRLPVDAFRRLVAATNMKQRTRKQIEYFHADRLGFAVAGTPNRLEYDQGFFVKNGDGAADVKPIAHLYKTQVYALAEHLEVPLAIRSRPPTTDTYSLAQTQDEFYFALPYPAMDLCLWGKNHGTDPGEVGAAIGMTREAVAAVYRDIDRKRRATRYLHERPLLVDPVQEIEHELDLGLGLGLEHSGRA
jgi:NAD+ synthase